MNNYDPPGWAYQLANSMYCQSLNVSITFELLSSSSSLVVEHDLQCCIVFRCCPDTSIHMNVNESYNLMNEYINGT